MLPSVDSLLACRVILLLISTARPVSVLLWIVLRNFLPPASEHRVTRTTQMTEKEREELSVHNTELGGCESHGENHSRGLSLVYERFNRLVHKSFLRRKRISFRINKVFRFWFWKQSAPQWIQILYQSTAVSLKRSILGTLCAAFLQSAPPTAYGGLLGANSPTNIHCLCIPTPPTQTHHPDWSKKKADSLY